MTVAEARRVLVASLPSSPEGAPRPALHGKILDLQTMSGLPDHEVEIRLPPLALAADQQPPATEPVVMRARSGADGVFRMQPPARVLPGVVAHAVVSDRAGERVFSGPVRAADEIVILVRPARLLHGVIADASKLCESPPGFALLQERRMVGTLVHALGRGTLDAVGAFAVRARVDWPDVPVRIKVGCDGMVFVLETDIATLSSAAGFHGRIGVGRCKLRVIDPQGAPLAGVAIAAAPRGSTMNGSFINRSTDAQGEASLLVPESGLELAAALAGHRTVVAFVPGTPAPRRLELVMEPLQARDFLEGRVLTGSGAPVGDAVVTALPAATAEVVQGVQPAQTRSDHNGLFRLQCGSADVDFDVTAFHKRYGISDMLRIRPAGQFVDLVLPGVRRLRIHAVAPDADNRSVGGEVQWFLVESGGRHLHGGAGPLPISTEPLAPGGYDLHLFWPDMELYGHARVDVAGTVTELPDEVVVALQPAIWFEGQVVADDPRGLRVAHRHPDWPEVIARFWGTARCDAQGRFRVLAGSRTSGRLEVLAPDGTVLLRSPAEWGQPAWLRLPPR